MSVIILYWTLEGPVLVQLAHQSPGKLAKPILDDDDDNGDDYCNLTAMTNSGLLPMMLLMKLKIGLQAVWSPHGSTVPNGSDKRLLQEKILQTQRLQIHPV